MFPVDEGSDVLHRREAQDQAEGVWPHGCRHEPEEPYMHCHPPRLRWQHIDNLITSCSTIIKHKTQPTNSYQDEIIVLIMLY